VAAWPDFVWKTLTQISLVFSSFFQMLPHDFKREASDRRRRRASRVRVAKVT
jgi:hypothetical protein